MSEKDNNTNIKYKKPELLMPAGGMETLKVAVRYGADAVYMGGSRFGLRAKADNFTYDEMKQALVATGVQISDIQTAGRVTQRV